MSRAWAVAFTAVSLVACTGPAPGTLCDEKSPCAAPLLCDPAEHLCRRPDAPTVVINAPSTDSVLTGGEVTVLGTLVLSDPVPEVPTLEWSLDGGPDQPAVVSGTGSPFTFTLTTPLPRIDDGLLTLHLRAQVPGSDPARGALDWPLHVDNVAPTVTVLPAAPALRNAEPALAFQFSEPVRSPVPIPVVLSPDAGAAQWLSNHAILSFPPLAYDTPYTATLGEGAVADLAGNPNDGGLFLRFLTRVHPPAKLEADAGLTFGSTAILQFDSASDEDGVLTVAVQLDTTPRTIAGFTFDSRTGEQVALGGTALGDGLTSLHAVAWSQQASSGAVLRYAGFVYDRTDPISSAVVQQAAWRVGDGGVQSASALALIPVSPAACESGAAADSVGLISPSPLEYTRAGSAAVGWTSSPQTWSYAGGEAWETAELSGSDLRRQGRSGCTTFGPLSLLSLQDARPAPNLSSAATLNGRRIYVYDGTNLGRTEVCCTINADGSCTINALRAIGSRAVVQSELEGGKVVAAREVSGRIELLERDATDCQSGWTVLGSIPSDGILQFRPVRNGPRPALLYLTFPEGVLRVFKPQP